jgi:uridine phosphorylase
MKRQDANRPQGAAGRQYHVGLRPGEVATSVLLCGDTARAARIAARFDSVRRGFPRRHREYATWTGTYRGREVTVMATGMGADNTEIAVVELLACVERPDLIRVGSCGALRRDVALGDLVISTGAVRLESASLGFVDEGYPAVAHHECVLALVTAASRLGRRAHVGVTATAAGFYGWQGRDVAGLASRHRDLPGRLAGAGVLNLEMEASALFTLASMKGLRSGAVCAAYANRPANAFLDAAGRRRADAAAIGVALGALDVLAEMDAARGTGPHFVVPEPRKSPRGRR